MTTSDEFRTKVQAGEIQDALRLAINQAIELKITTWIASGERKTTPQTQQTPSPEYLCTRINIVDGQIDNEVSQKLLDHSLYAELQKLHSTQVVQGSQTIQNNLDSLQKLAKLLKDLELTLGPEYLSQERAAETSVVPLVSEIQTQVIFANSPPEATSLEPESLPEQTSALETYFSPNKESEPLWSNSVKSNIFTESEASAADEDWGDLLPEKATDFLEVSANPAVGEDWDDWEMEELEPQAESTFTPLDVLEGEEEEEWSEEEDWEEQDNQHNVHES